MKRIALFAGLSLIAGPAFAAFGVESLINMVIYLLIVGAIAGLLIFLVRRAPFIPGEFKSVIEYVIYFVLVIMLIYFLLGLTGHPLGR